MLICGVLGAMSPEEKDWNSLSFDEKIVIYNSYITGVKYDVGWSLGAICWQESKGGRWQISIDHNDYSRYNVSLYWYFKEHKIPDTRYNRSKYGTLLLTKPKIAEDYVIKKLKRAYKFYGNWMIVWERYNGSKEYAYKIQKKVMFLKRTFQ